MSCTASLPASTEPLNETLLENFLPLVDRAVSSIARNLPSHVDLDDLHSVGVMGLIAAVRRYNAAQGDTFEAYALMRIKGAILDELRRLDSLPRTARAKARNLQETVQGLEQRLGRTPTDHEIRSALGLTPTEFDRLRRQTQPISLLSLDTPQISGDGREVDLHDAIPDEGQIEVGLHVENDEMTELLFEQMQRLPERQRKIIAMIYFEGLRLSEIADAFGVTEARICQIRNQAVARLRSSLQHALAE